MKGLDRFQGTCPQLECSVFILYLIFWLYIDVWLKPFAYSSEQEGIWVHKSTNQYNMISISFWYNSIH